MKPNIVEDLYRDLDRNMLRLSAHDLTGEQAARLRNKLRETIAVVESRNRDPAPERWIPPFALRIKELYEEKDLATKELASDYGRLAEINNQIFRRKRQLNDIQVAIEANLKLAYAWSDSK